MKVLLVNTYDKGGAAKACMRLHEGLLQQGVEANLLLLTSNADYPANRKIDIFKKKFPYIYKKLPLLQRIAIKAGMMKKREQIKKEIEQIPKNQLEIFTYPYSNYDITLHPWYKEADIINLHWASSFIDYSFFSKNLKPVVWTLHDMNAFTGGCHYSGGCNKFTKDCGYCHYLRNTSYPTFTHKLLKYKLHHINNARNVHIVSPSKWLANAAHSSTLLKKNDYSIIPYGLNTEILKPYPKKEAKKAFNLPEEKKILLFAAQNIENPRKGLNYIFDAVRALNNNPEVVICVLGKTSTRQYSNMVLLGEIENEEKIAMAYSAADALLVPSLEDNLPNTALESILCGTPVIAFPIGGLRDIVEEGRNGYLSENLNSESFLKKIVFFLRNNVSLSSKEISETAKFKYDLAISAGKYIKTFEKLLQNKNAG